MSVKAAAAVDPQDLALVRDWFRQLAEHVRLVDFAPARALFAEDAIAFGTYSDFLHGRDRIEQEQWRKVWPTIDGFTWRLEGVQAVVSPDRLHATGMAVWDSTGYRPDGTSFDRRGRATVALARERVGDPWVATHTHMSIFRGTPDVSHGARPSRS